MNICITTWPRRSNLNVASAACATFVRNDQKKKNDKSYLKERMLTLTQITLWLMYLSAPRVSLIVSLWWVYKWSRNWRICSMGGKSSSQNPAFTRNLCQICHGLPTWPRRVVAQRGFDKLYSTEKGWDQVDGGDWMRSRDRQMEGVSKDCCRVCFLLLTHQVWWKGSLWLGV